MTLKEIAKKAGVSTATVSYVLNDSSKVSEKTREKVMKIVEETGYKSNLLAKSLRSSRTHVLGVIVEDIQTKHTPAIIDGINEMAEKSGYQILLCNLRLLTKIGSHFQDISTYQHDIDNVVETLHSMRVDGIIYVGMHDRLIDHVLRNVGIPLVYCYCYTNNEGSSVSYNNEKATYELTRKYIEYGHRSFGVIYGEEDSEPSQKRLSGIRKSLSEADIPLNDKFVRCGRWKFEDARICAREMLTDPDCPKAILALNDEMALALCNEAFTLGISIPRDLSISGFDNSDLIRYSYTKIATVEPPLGRMGYRSVELLLKKIDSEESEDVNIILPCRIIEGETIRDLRKN